MEMADLVHMVWEDELMSIDKDGKYIDDVKGGILDGAGIAASAAGLILT